MNCGDERTVSAQRIDQVIEKLAYHPDRCPEYGTSEHAELGGGRGPVYEPVRYIEDQIRARREHERIP